MSDVIEGPVRPGPCTICGEGEARTLYRLPAGTLVRCAGCATVRRANLVDGEAAAQPYDDGSRALDRVARMLGGPYRMIVYARKR